MVRNVLGYEMLTSKEVAELLGLKPYTIREYVRRGILKGVKYGRGWHFTTDEVKRFISGGAAGSDQGKDKDE